MLTFNRSTSVKLVTLVVDNVQFEVNRDRILQVSPAFTAALTSGFKESKEEVFSFTEEDVATITTFSDWLNTNQFSITVGDDHQCTHDLDHAVKVLVFADKWNIQSMFHCVFKETLAHMQRLNVECWNKVPSLPMVRLAYNETAPYCPLRLLLCDAYASKLGSWFETSTARAALVEMADFAVDLLLAHRPKSDHSTRWAGFHAKTCDNYIGEGSADGIIGLAHYSEIDKKRDGEDTDSD